MCYGDQNLLIYNTYLLISIICRLCPLPKSGSFHMVPMLQCHDKSIGARYPVVHLSPQNDRWLPELTVLLSSIQALSSLRKLIWRVYRRPHLHRKRLIMFPNRARKVPLLRPLLTQWCIWTSPIYLANVLARRKRPQRTQRYAAYISIFHTKYSRIRSVLSFSSH